MENKKELYKYYYDYWKQAGWNTNKLINLTTPELNIESIRKCALHYATEYLNISEEKFYEEMAKTLFNNKIHRTGSFYLSQEQFKVIEKLSDINNQDKINLILQTSNLDLKNLKIKINEYTRIYRFFEKNSLPKQLTTKISLYEKKEKDSLKENLIKEKEQINLLSKAQETILDYASEENTNKSEFCQKNNLSQETFDQYLNLIKKYDPKTYIALLQKISNEREKNYKDLIQKIPAIINLIKNGIETENNPTPREVNILDYYLIASISLEELEKIIDKEKEENKLTPENYLHLKRFIAQNKNITLCNDRDIEFLLNQTHIVNIKTDSKGNYIENSGQKLTREEKQEIINFLNDNNIPLTKKIFNFAVLRYADKTLKKEKRNTSKK